MSATNYEAETVEIKSLLKTVDPTELASNKKKKKKKNRFFDIT